MSNTPIIAITIDVQDNSKQYVYSKNRWYALGKAYADNISNAGAVVLLLPVCSAQIPDILSIIDGLVITGGRVDIHPKFYNEEILSDKLYIPHTVRAEFELKIAEKALRMNMPILGICNGMQILNVVQGGTLIQDIPTFVPNTIIHHEGHLPPSTVAHTITIENNTKLIEIAEGYNDHSVNSFHHLAIKKLGQGLIISAKSPDGIIEAIESTNHDFVIGVQWHPEYLASGSLDQSLFIKFTQAAMNYKEKKKHQETLTV